MDFGLKGKSALILAGSKGLGKACAMALAREGASLTVNARDSASTWSSFRPYGKSRNSSRKAWFQLARTIATLPASTWDATGAARVSFEPVSRDVSIR